MRNTMKYKDYSGSVEYSDEDGVFFGRIIGINDRITSNYILVSRVMADKIT